MKNNGSDLYVRLGALFLMIVLVIFSVCFGINKLNAQTYTSDIFIHECILNEKFSDVILDSNGYASVYIDENLLVRGYMVEKEITDSAFYVMGITYSGIPFILSKYNNHILLEYENLIILFIVQ